MNWKRIALASVIAHAHARSHASVTSRLHQKRAGADEKRGAAEDVVQSSEELAPETVDFIVADMRRRRRNLLTDYLTARSVIQSVHRSSRPGTPTRSRKVP